MCYNQTGNIATLDGASLKLVDKFTYLGSSVSSTEKDIDTRLTKAWTAIDRLSIIWKSDLTDKMKRSFFQAAVVSILLYGCTTWTLTKRLERRLDGNYTRMLRAVLNKSWRQHPTRLQLYGHLPPITKTIQVRRTRHAGHCWRSKDELISDVLLWTPTHGCASVGRPARTYIQQLCEDTGCNPEDLPEAMSDREKWRETVRDIRADGATWWWWLYIRPDKTKKSHNLTRDKKSRKRIYTTFTRFPIWHSKISVRFEALWPPASIGPPSSGRAALIAQHSTRPLWSSLSYEQALMPDWQADDQQKSSSARTSVCARPSPPYPPTIKQPCIMNLCQVLSGGRQRLIILGFSYFYFYCFCLHIFVSTRIVKIGSLQTYVTNFNFFLIYNFKFKLDEKCKQNNKHICNNNQT